MRTTLHVIHAIHVTAATLALAILGSRAHAAPQVTADCPNTKASQVDARVENGGNVRRCGVGIRIFGIGGGIFGPRCPEMKFTYPSHQECNGDQAQGTLCEPEGQIPVTFERCECSSATFLGTGLLIPSCSCASGGTAGHVEDARTVPCRAEV
jgi:hypothetical protein